MEGRLSYILRRLLWVPPILIVVTFATFTLARFGPGDPVRVAAGNFRDEEAFERIRAARGLDKPIYEQYYIYMRDVVTKGDFGESYRFQGVTVNEVLFPAMWRSFQYNIVALIITVSIGIRLRDLCRQETRNMGGPRSHQQLPRHPIGACLDLFALRAALFLPQAGNLAGQRLASGLYGDVGSPW